MIIRVLFSVGITTLALSGLWAQLDENASTELLKPFRANLAESRKLQANPILPKIDTNLGKNLEYQVPTRLLALNYPPPVLRPVAMREDKDREARGLYLKAGIGYPLSPLFDLSYFNKEAKQLSYGFKLNHHSGRGASIENQRFSFTRAEAQGVYQTNSALALAGQLGGRFDGYRFYAAPRGESLSRDSALQLFSEFTTRLQAYNAKATKSGIGYRGVLDFYALGDRYEASELGLAPQIQVDKWLGGKNAPHRLALDAGLFYTSFKDALAGNDSLNGARNLVWANPSFEYNSRFIKGSAGFNLGSSEGKFFIFPDLQIAFNLAKKGEFTVYGGWVGEIQAQTFRSLAMLNPFLISTPELRHARSQSFYGGVRGQIKQFRYDGRLGLQSIQNIAIFQNDSASNYRCFALQYDTATVFFIKGSIEWQILRELSLQGRIASYGYSLRQSERAYHLPILESNFGLRYQRQKFEVYAELYFNGGVAYFDEINRVNGRLGPLLDFNLGGQYHFTDKIGAFVSLNNLFNNQNQRWHYYPQIGFNGMVGVLVRL